MAPKAKPNARPKLKITRKNAPMKVKPKKGQGKSEADAPPQDKWKLPRNVKSIDELVKAVDIKDADHKDC